MWKHVTSQIIGVDTFVGYVVVGSSCQAICHKLKHTSRTFNNSSRQCNT
jgi:hypothetical protein